MSTKLPIRAQRGAQARILGTPPYAQGYLTEPAPTGSKSTTALHGRTSGLLYSTRGAPESLIRDCITWRRMGSVWVAGRPRASVLPAATAAKVLCFTSAPPTASRSPQAAEALPLARPLRKVLA